MQIFSISHIIYLLICCTICVLFYFSLRKKSKKVQYISILSMLSASFVLHFLKLLMPFYRNDLPNSLISITPENLCAISTLVFPFIFVFKNKALKDYMVIFGITSGFLTLMFPGDIIGYSPLNLEVIRFFFAHLSIFMCPLFTLLFSFHKPTKHYIRNTLLILFLTFNIMIIDQIIFTYILHGQSGLDSLINSLSN